MTYKLLDKINLPEDLRELKIEDLKTLSGELRDFLIREMARNPGHFGASLGVVELTVALHYVFNTPHDRIVWDVGHQAYSHKILTGRKDLFHTNRKLGGICGFPSPKESEYDAFIAGHSSTSISAALGMAIASELKGDNKQTIAVIGDGAMTGGMAFEALNNASIIPNNMLIILNDNEIAISRNVGGLSNYLVDISTSRTYNRMREGALKSLSRIGVVTPRFKDNLARINNSIKALLTRGGNIFEGFNIRYFGPVDGHDIEHMIHILEDMKTIKGPKVLHIKTTKGKGFQPAEQSQIEWHAPGKFSVETGERETASSPQKGKGELKKYQEVFGETIVELAESNEKIFGITPAMPTGCSLDIMMERMPERAMDVGIAEQHAVTFSAGLAKEGVVPFCNIYSSFMQRSYDQLIHDVALQQLPVVFCLDRGGLVGEDGATHHGVFDLAFMRSIPNLVVSSPMNEEELRNLMYTAQLAKNGPFSIRYPRGNGVMEDWRKPFKELPVGKARVLKEGNEVVFLTIGHIGNTVTKVIKTMEKQGHNPGHVNMVFLKPLDKDVLHTVAKSYKYIVCVEDGVTEGGLGSTVSDFMIEHRYTPRLIKIGVPDTFVEHGTQNELYHLCGMDHKGILQQTYRLIGKVGQEQEEIVSLDSKEETPSHHS